VVSIIRFVESHIDWNIEWWQNNFVNDQRLHGTVATENERLRGTVATENERLRGTVATENIRRAVYIVYIDRDRSILLFDSAC
jgi:hypothetical protein